MRYGVIFATLAGFLCWRATLGGWRVVLAWPAVSFGVLALAYFLQRPSLIGKQPSGGHRLFQALLMLPYLALVRVAWHGLRLVRRHETWDEVWPDVLVGRRLLNHEKPEGVDSVVDLTCEFGEPPNIVDAGKYIALPTLDQTPPPARALLEVVDHCLSWPGRVYIHCAEGHGRAGTVAVCMAIVRADADDLPEAYAFVKARRRGTRLTRRQRARVVEILPELLARRA